MQTKVQQTIQYKTMKDKIQNYYIGYPPTENIEDFESVIVGTLDQHFLLEDSRIVVKTPLGVSETPSQLSNFEKHTCKEVQQEINKIETNGSN